MIEDTTKCASHHRFELMLTDLSASYKEIYGLICGTPSNRGILEWMRQIDSKLDAMKSEQESRDEHSETRFWMVLRIVGPWLLGLLAVYFGFSA